LQLEPVSVITVFLAVEEPSLVVIAVAVLTSLGLTAAGFVVRSIAERGASGAMDRDGLAGIRTRATMASDQAWLVGHQAGLAPTKLGGLALVATGTLGIGSGPIMTAFGRWDPNAFMMWWTVSLLIGLFGSVSLIIYGTAVGDRAAKAMLSELDTAAD